MNLTVYIPDEIAGSLSTGGDLSRRVLEGFAIEEYKSERISKAQLRRLLGFETGYELDAFLKAHQVPPNITKIYGAMCRISRVWDSDGCSWSSPAPARSTIRS